MDQDGNDPHPTESPVGPALVPSPSTPVEAGRTQGARRQTVEFLILLGIGILLLRTFAAEAYVVPTGSMAPTLLGFHKEITCPTCNFTFVIGMDDEGRTGRPVCPNCGQDGLSQTSAVECNGDRLLVQKFLFDFRRPGRWEVAVFHSPAEPEQAYVKRVVGLPGEAVQVVDGDVVIDGRIARKSLREQRAMRILLYDNDFLPADSDRYPRWTFRGDRYRRAVKSGWRTDGSRFVHDRTATSGDREDWLEYRHYDPARSGYGPVRDFCPYNGGDDRGDNVVRDLMVEADLTCRPDVRSVAIRLDHGPDHFVISLPVGESGPPEVRRNGRVLEVSNVRGGLAASPQGQPRWSHVEASVIDRQVAVAIDGLPLFDPIEFENDPGLSSHPLAPPLAIGMLGGSMEIKGLRVYRDIYYTGAISVTARRPFGIEAPYLLKADEFFVLGDNSPISNDSRFWVGSPVVRGDLFVGKPFLVHLPGQVTSLRVFGRPIGWIPDPREIRYIR